MSRPLSRPEAEAARIWAEAKARVEADEPRPDWNDRDQEWVDRCVAATDPDTNQPTRLNRRTR